MPDAVPGEIIIVRSLTESDLGLFAAHRASASSKQRAININAPAARRLLSAELFDAGSTSLDCEITFCGRSDRAKRHFGKVGKNWRLGGKKLEGSEYTRLDCKDFMLIRSVAPNDATIPIGITFVSRDVDRIAHAGLAAIVQKLLDNSMAVFTESDEVYEHIARYCSASVNRRQGRREKRSVIHKDVPEMPREAATGSERTRSIEQKVRSPYILERMLKVAGDLSAPAQRRFMETVQLLASQLRQILRETGGIIKIEKNHSQLWESVSGKQIGFVDGGLANLSMLGSTPIAARVGGYIVTPGDRSPERERFIVLKLLIDELFTSDSGGVYEDSFPDIGALRDVARITIETAGALTLLAENPAISWLFTHGALVNPVSRYTDIVRDGQIKHRFPSFAAEALSKLLPAAEAERDERGANFISVHLRQLQLLQDSGAVVCGVVERESTSVSVCKAVVDGFEDQSIADMLHRPPAEWKAWFKKSIDPADDDDGEGQRITDSLLFRCVLEPGEALLPVPLNRNDMRRAPHSWETEISQYPKPWVSYLQPTEWTAPFRVEMFEKDKVRFAETATLVMHCAFLLPRYAFPVGMDIVDKFAHIPNWMSRPVNTHTVVQALKQALESGQSELFDQLRRMLCGSRREWFLRPGGGP